VIGDRINTIIMIIIEPSTGSKTFSYFVHQSLVTFGGNVQILSTLHHLMNSLMSWIFLSVPRSLLGVSIRMWLPKY